MITLDNVSIIGAQDKYDMVSKSIEIRVGCRNWFTDSPKIRRSGYLPMGCGDQSREASALGPPNGIQLLGGYYPSSLTAAGSHLVIAVR